jgi:hypothetical protein
VNGAPNGLSVPRWSLSKTHLKGSRPWASLSRNYRLTRAPSSTWRRRDASEALYEGLGRRNQGDLGGCRFADSFAWGSVRAIARPTMITGKPEDRRPSLTREPGDLPSLVQPTSGEVTDGLYPSPCSRSAAGSLAAWPRMRLSRDVRVPTASVPHFRARSHGIDLFARAQTYFAHSLSGRLSPSVHVRTPM